MGASKMIVEEFHGVVPKTMDNFSRYRRGTKYANVVLGCATELRRAWLSTRTCNAYRSASTSPPTKIRKKSSSIL